MSLFLIMIIIIIIIIIIITIIMMIMITIIVTIIINFYSTISHWSNGNLQNYCSSPLNLGL